MPEMPHAQFRIASLMSPPGAGVVDLIERFFNRLKHLRRIGTRYDTTETSWRPFCVPPHAYGPVLSPTNRPVNRRMTYGGARP
jgi:hypothetical protein